MLHTAQSSSGDIKFDAEGKVVEVREYPDCIGELSIIKTVDVAALGKVYPDGIPEEVDILECGYWTHDGQYEPPLHWDGEQFIRQEDAF